MVVSQEKNRCIEHIFAPFRGYCSFSPDNPGSRIGRLQRGKGFKGDINWTIEAVKPPVPLDVTLQFIKDKMMEHPEFNYVALIHNTADNSDFNCRFRRTVSDVKILSQTCLLGYHVHVERVGNVLADVPTAGIPFREVIKTEVMTKAETISRAAADVGSPNLICTGTNPVLYTVNVIRQGERVDALDFQDADTANRVAKAVNHAAEVCGGGQKRSPF
jgi:hypothetical protein